MTFSEKLSNCAVLMLVVRTYTCFSGSLLFILLLFRNVCFKLLYFFFLHISGFLFYFQFVFMFTYFPLVFLSNEIKWLFKNYKQYFVTIKPTGFKMTKNFHLSGGQVVQRSLENVLTFSYLSIILPL